MLIHVKMPMNSCDNFYDPGFNFEARRPEEESNKQAWEIKTERKEISVHYNFISASNKLDSHEQTNRKQHTVRQRLTTTFILNI